jgi:hypothetical protein
MRDVEIKPLLMFSLLDKCLTGRRFGLGKDVKACGAVVPAAAQKVLCGRDPLAGVSIKRLLQCSWELFLTTTTSSNLQELYFNNPHNISF